MAEDDVATIIEKVPGDDFDLSINWQARSIGTDTIAESAWSVTGADSALTLDDPEIIPPNNVATSIFIAGGTLNNYYVVINRVVTSGGRIFNRCFLVKLVPFIYVTQSRCL